MISITLRSLEILLQAWHSQSTRTPKVANTGRCCKCHRRRGSSAPVTGALAWLGQPSRGARQNAAPRLLEPNGHHIAVINTVAFLHQVGAAQRVRTGILLS